MHACICPLCSPTLISVWCVSTHARWCPICPSYYPLPPPPPPPPSWMRIKPCDSYATLCSWSRIPLITCCQSTPSLYNLFLEPLCVLPFGKHHCDIPTLFSKTWHWLPIILTLRIFFSLINVLLSLLSQIWYLSLLLTMNLHLPPQFVTPLG